MPPNRPPFISIGDDLGPCQVAGAFTIRSARERNAILAFANLWFVLPRRRRAVFIKTVKPELKDDDLALPLLFFEMCCRGLDKRSGLLGGDFSDADTSRNACMLHESERTPEPEDNKPASPDNGQARPCPPPAGSQAERLEIARVVGFPSAAWLTYSDVERQCRQLLDWEL